MRLGLIADIHGNLPALERVLAELEQERVDQIICLGDVAVGPQPVETLERVEALGCPTIMGNWDACMLGATPRVDGELAEMLVGACTWSAEQLAEPHREFIRSFEDMLELAVGDTSLLLFHGSPRSFDDFIFATTPDDEVERMLDGHHADFFVGGHTHFQMFRRYRDHVVLNVGSVGQPFRRRRRGVMHIFPWAEYCLMTQDGGEVRVELRRTPVDVDSFVEILLSSGMPYADRWAEHWAPEASGVG